MSVPITISIMCVIIGSLLLGIWIKRTMRALVENEDR